MYFFLPDFLRGKIRQNNRFLKSIENKQQL